MFDWYKSYTQQQLKVIKWRRSMRVFVCDSDDLRCARRFRHALIIGNRASQGHIFLKYTDTSEAVRWSYSKCSIIRNGRSSLVRYIHRDTQFAHAYAARMQPVRSLVDRARKADSAAQNAIAGLVVGKVHRMGYLEKVPFVGSDPVELIERFAVFLPPGVLRDLESML